MRNIRIRLLAVTAVFALCITTLNGCSFMRSDIPDEAHFDEYMKRDLEQRFGGTLKRKVNVTYELFRKEATKGGAPYPQYFAWVKVYDAEKLLGEGAVYMIAVRGVQFEVMEFLSVAQIKQDPKSIEAIFPAELCPKIMERVQDAESASRAPETQSAPDAKQVPDAKPLPADKPTPTDNAIP